MYAIAGGLNIRGAAVVSVSYFSFSVCCFSFSLLLLFKAPDFPI